MITAPEPNEPIYAITNDRLLVGETAQINLTDGYASSTSYSSSDPAVVSVDAWGRVNALSNGTAFITITAYGDMMFSSITRQIKVVVSPQPGLSHEFCFCDYPVFGTSNIITSSSTQLQLHAVNRGFGNTSCTIYAVPHLDDGYSEPMSIDYGVCASGSEFTSSEDVSLWLPHLTDGKVYRVDFYSDVDCTRPMNVPSAYFMYCSEQPSVSHLTKAVAQAKKGECPLGLVKNVIEEILKSIH